VPFSDGPVEQVENSRMQRLIQVVDPCVVSVNGESVLNEIICSYAEEVRVLREVPSDQSS
jgi:hypothetical protein